MFHHLIEVGRRVAWPRRSHARLCRTRLCIVFALSAMLLGIAAALAQAQVPPPEGEDPGDAEENAFDGAEVMFVEAQRRSQDLQKVPESVSSFSADDLLAQGLVNFNDLQYNVPSLFSGDGLSKITLRGVGSEIVGPGIDPGFAVHVNSVFSSRESTGRLDFFDIERVDILRGPQGTLWGRNSTGGAMNIITRRPIHEFDVSADAAYESFREGAQGTRIRGMLNMPIVDETLALRVAFLTHFNDGLTMNRSEFNRQHVNDAKTASLRASLRWEPDENVTVDLIGTYFRSDAAGSAPKFDGAFTTAPTIASAGIGPGTNFDGALRNRSNPYRATADETQNSDSTVYTATLLVGWQADDFKVDSITGYQSTDFFIHRDFDGSSLPIATLDLIDRSRQVSQEFLINSTWESAFNYTFGTNYQYDWTPKTEVFLTNPQNTLDSANYRLIPIFLGRSFVDGCTSFGAPGCPNIKPVGRTQEDFTRAVTEVENHVFGLYGNLRWEVIDDLTLSAGGRFSYTHRDWDDQTFAQSFAAFAADAGLFVLQLGRPQDHSWSAGTWKLTADYQASDDHLLWLSVGTGSRAGGFNFADEQEFGDERVLAVEGGIKSVFFDRRLVLNISGFWYDWADPQIGSTENSLPITVNAPSAESYGVDVEWQAFPLPDLELNGSFGWLEAEYDEQFLSFDTSLPDFSGLVAAPTGVDIEGNRLPRSPQFSVSAGAQYTIELNGFGSATTRVDFYFRDEISFRQFGNAADAQSSYTRTDARMTWRSPTDRFWVEVFARNLEDERVKTNQEIQFSIYRAHFYDAPRSGGFRVGYNFL